MDTYAGGSGGHDSRPEQLPTTSTLDTVQITLGCILAVLMLTIGGTCIVAGVDMLGIAYIVYAGAFACYSAAMLAKVIVASNYPFAAR